MAAATQESQSVPKPDAETQMNRPGPTATRAKASIPFEFWIGPEKLPAGDYTLQVVVPSVAIIRSADGKLEQELYMVNIGASVPANDSKLIFAVRNGRYMLWELWSINGKRRLSAVGPAEVREGDMTRVVDLSYY
jgi:hypothetical protein